jgi:rhamnosyltransferase
MRPFSPHCTLIVPARDEAGTLPRCLEGIAGQAYRGRVRVVVVDSGSADGTPDLAARLGAEVLRVAPAEFSHGRTRQQAAEKAGDEFLVFTVADAVPADSHWLAALVAPLEDPGIAGSHGVQIVPDGPGVDPFARWVARGQERLGDRVLRFPTPGDWDRLSSRRKRAAANFDNCTSCVRRSLLLGAFPFPDVPYGEDMFWAAGVLRAGHGIARASGARVVHYHRGSFSYLFHRMLLDARLCRDRFGHRPVANAAALVARWILLAAKVGVIAGVLSPGVPPYRIDSKAYWALRDLWVESGGLLGKYGGGLPSPEDVPSWRVVRKALARMAERRVHVTPRLHRNDFA